MARQGYRSHLIGLPIVVALNACGPVDNNSERQVPESITPSRTVADYLAALYYPDGERKASPESVEDMTISGTVKGALFDEAQIAYRARICWPETKEMRTSNENPVPHPAPAGLLAIQPPPENVYCSKDDLKGEKPKARPHGDPVDNMTPYEEFVSGLPVYGVLKGSLCRREIALTQDSSPRTRRRWARTIRVGRTSDTEVDKIIVDTITQLPQSLPIDVRITNLGESPNLLIIGEDQKLYCAQNNKSVHCGQSTADSCPDSTQLILREQIAKKLTFGRRSYYRDGTDFFSGAPSSLMVSGFIVGGPETIEGAVCILPSGVFGSESKNARKGVQFVLFEDRKAYVISCLLRSLGLSGQIRISRPGEVGMKTSVRIFPFLAVVTDEAGRNSVTISESAKLALNLLYR